MNSRADHHPRKVIPYKEYAAHKEAEGKALTTSKPTLEDKENWDEELPLPPWETLPGARPMQPSQEDKWKLMVDRDPHSGSVAGDSGHGMMAVTPKAEPVDNNEELVGAVGGIDENISAENLSDVEWKEDDPLFKFNEENVTIPQTPTAALTLPRQKTKQFNPLNHPSERNLVSRSQSQYVFQRQLLHHTWSLTTVMQSQWDTHGLNWLTSSLGLSKRPKIWWSEPLGRSFSA